MLLPARLGALGLRWLDGVFCLILLLTGTLYFAGIQTVPFHPDESTQIFMSADLDLLITHPDQLFWNANPVDELRQHYRELDAPLTRYLIGAGRWIGRFAGLPSDWDWTKTWSANEQQGALPGAALLLAARLSVAWLFPLSLVLIYLACRKAGHPLAGMIACLILAIHPVALLHTRRAMAESALLFGSTLLVWVLSITRIRPWVAGMIGAIAASAKQSALGLFPAALIAFTWPASFKITHIRIPTILIRLAEALGCLALVTFLVNPFLWQNPVAAASAALKSRQDLLSGQVAAFQGEYPGGSVSFSNQVLVVLGQIYLAPIQFEEAGNYLANTAAQKQAYLQNPYNDVLRGLIWGAAFLFLTTIGIALSLKEILFDRSENRRWLGLLFIATAGEFLTIVIALPLPFQRYVIPLLPLVCIWSGLGVEVIVGRFAIRKNG